MPKGQHIRFSEENDSTDTTVNSKSDGQQVLPTSRKRKFSSSKSEGNGHHQKTSHHGHLNSKGSSRNGTPVDDEAYAKRRMIREQLYKERQKLPIFKVKDDICNQVLKNKVTILVGQTGSGKSTQVPQFLVDLALSSNDDGGDGTKSMNRIAVTQPRKVAAINLAKRVAAEFGTQLGHRVGYSVRFQNCSTPKTWVKYLTDGMLLREILLDPDLSQYSVIILDEVHERTILTDLIMGFIKGLLRRRDDVRVVIMSATLEAEKFSAFFDNSTIMHVEGRTYPVERVFSRDPVQDVVDGMASKILELHNKEKEGDILAFLPGQEDIDKVVDILRKNESPQDSEEKNPFENKSNKKKRKSKLKLVAYPLYAALNPDQQQIVFSALPKDTRKVVVATNIAETSVTIPGVRYVVDSGTRKIKVWKHDLGLDTLLTTPVSQASAIQRSGRAGREAPGKCYFLYTKATFETLSKQTEPEIHRCDISYPILVLKKAGVQDVLNWDWLDAPAKGAILSALTQLYALKALDNSGSITSFGQKMSILPVAPHLAAVMLTAKERNLAEPVIDIVSCLSIENIIQNPGYDSQEIIYERRKNAFAASQRFGDLILLKQIYDTFLEIPSKPEQKIWAKDHGLNFRALENVSQVRKQLRRYLKLDDESGHSVSNGPSKFEQLSPQDIQEILRCFLVGFISNTAIGQADRTFRSVMAGHPVRIHPSSSVFGNKVEAIMYIEYVFTTKGYARMVSPIQLNWLQEIAPHVLKRHSAET